MEREKLQTVNASDSPKFRNSIYCRGLVATGVGVLLASVAIAPASATTENDPNEAIDVIREIAPESFEAVSTNEGVVVESEEAATPDEFGRSAATEPFIDPTNPTSEVKVEIPSDPSDGIAIEQSNTPGIVVGLPNADKANDAAYGELDIATYDNNDGSTTVPILKPDGTVQITTVIDGADAPTHYEYPITLPAGGKLIDAGEGYFAALDSEDMPIAMIEPAWALDANGNDVSTHYEIDGDTLIQVVEHQEGDAYPIVADPAVKGKYISKVTTAKQNGGYTVSVYPVNSWNPTVGASNYWAEYKLYVGVLFEKPGMYDQLKCHYDFAPFKVPWNLDTWRPDVSYSDTVAALCNP